MTSPDPDPTAAPTGRVRVRVDLAYDGTGFSGWARQPGRQTVQQHLEEALAEAFGQPVPVVCAGRTDAGVHARGQVVHADLPDVIWSRRTPHGLRAILNRLTDERVWVRRVHPAPHGFDARFSALSRHYAYRMWDDPGGVDPLTRRWVVHHRRPLDAGAMARAAAALVGEHDFAAFCRPREGASTVRRVLSVDVGRDEQRLLVVAIGADAFCHSMVRSLVGALVAVGEGRRRPEWVAQVLAARVRDSAVTVMPPSGLVLERVEYPPDDLLGKRARTARQFRAIAASDPPT